VKTATLKYWKEFVGSLKNPIGKTITRLVAGKAIEVVIEMIPLMEGMFDLIENGEDMILFGAKALVVFHADKNAELANINACLAYQNASLVGETLGVGSFFAGFVLRACTHDRNGNVNRVIGVPENHGVYAVMAIGYAKYDYKNYIRKKPAKVRWII